MLSNMLVVLLLVLESSVTCVTIMHKIGVFLVLTLKDKRQCPVSRKQVSENWSPPDQWIACHSGIAIVINQMVADFLRRKKQKKTNGAQKKQVPNYAPGNGGTEYGFREKNWVVNNTTLCRTI